LDNKDRRTARRFKMKLPLTVRWNTDAAVAEAATVSEEVSSRGVTFSLPRELKDGSAVEILMTLPHEITMAGPVRVKCLARVRRAELDSGADAARKVGVVADIERYEFVRGDNFAA